MPPPYETPLFCWGITEGSAGMANQVQGLADALGWPCALKTARRTWPWVKLPAWFRWGALRQMEPGSDALAPPWPDALITCGRRSVPFALAIKRASGGRTFCIHITNPNVPPSRFDLVIAPAHDALAGPNVIQTRYAVHHITARGLADAREKFTGRFADMPPPICAALIGGSTNRYRLTPDAMRSVITQMETLLGRFDGSLLITPSRRTGPEPMRILREAFGARARAYLYQLRDENPYLGLLAFADWIFVTNDSVNMMSEAAATGKPIYILPFPGHHNTPPARFAQKLCEQGIARVFEGRLERWRYAPVEEMGEVARQVGERFAAFRKEAYRAVA